MIDDIDPEIDLIAGTGIILQILLEMEVPDKRSDADIIVPGIDPDIIIILAIDQGSIGEQPAVEQMVPAQGRCGIAIVDPESIAEPKIVLAQIARKIEVILAAERIVGLG